MPMRRSLYAASWDFLSYGIRMLRAKGRCECRGECGLHRSTPGPRRCIEQHQRKARWARGTVVLTVAHKCHNHACINPTHLAAMCQRCHLRYDAPMRRARRQNPNQINLVLHPITVNGPCMVERHA